MDEFSLAFEPPFHPLDCPGNGDPVDIFAAFSHYTDGEVGASDSLAIEVGEVEIGARA